MAADKKHKSEAKRVERQEFKKTVASSKTGKNLLRGKKS
jgi:hypothetical protein